MESPLPAFDTPFFKYEFPLVIFRLKQTTNSALKAFIALREGKRYIPVDLLDFIVEDMKKQVEKYDLEHNTEVSLSKPWTLKAYLDNRTGTKEEVYNLLEEKWGIDADSVRQIYKRHKAKFDEIDKMQHPDWFAGGDGVLYDANNVPINDK
jgi:hypothetical protein